MPRVKQPFGCELPFEFLKGSLHRADTLQFYVSDVNLIFTARRIDIDFALHAHRIAILWERQDTAGVRLKEDTTDLAVRVFQREIDMSRCRTRPIGNLSLHPHIL